MIVLDTHAWLWLYENDNRLSRPARDVIAEADVIGVAAISLWEVAMLERRGRVAISRPILDWLKSASGAPGIRVLGVTSEIAAESAALSLSHGDPADRMIVATALVHHTSLVTRDGKIRESGLVETVW